ncbi:hypothetical protein [Microcoleus sp. B9-D4]|uniref:hypothetical protein n=1 Tax=Microcoleus sp. B9-D4 TaxID=2818711 RepID=UPI002FD64CEF
MHEQFDREHNFHFHEPHAHQIHHADFTIGDGDENNFLSDWLIEGAIFVFNLFS